MKKAAFLLLIPCFTFGQINQNKKLQELIKKFKTDPVSIGNIENLLGQKENYSNCIFSKSLMGNPELGLYFDSYNNVNFSGLIIDITKFKNIFTSKVFNFSPDDTFLKFLKNNINPKGFWYSKINDKYKIYCNTIELSYGEFKIVSEPRTDVEIAEDEKLIGNDMKNLSIQALERLGNIKCKLIWCRFNASDTPPQIMELQRANE